jgi:outer membrane lipoprotein-sorting protein
MTPSQVKNEVLARIADWRTVQETVDETVASGPHAIPQHLVVSFISQSSPAAFRMQVAPKTGTPFEVLDNGLSTIEYTKGSDHYAVSVSNANTLSLYRLTGLELVGALQASRVQSFSVSTKALVLHLLMPITPGVMAKAVLWFNLNTNAPTRLTAQWHSGSLNEVPVAIHINPTIPSSAFSFSAPSGASPEVALTPSGTAIDQAQSRVPFPIILPPSSSSLQLTGVNVGTARHNPVVLLTYESQHGEPVVITESKAAVYKPPSGLSTVTETVGTLTAKVGTMPDGQEMAGIVVHKTLIVVQGPVKTVDDLVNGWANAVSSPSSASP